jgi:hypothetical protein
MFTLFDTKSGYNSQIKLTYWEVSHFILAHFGIQHNDFTGRKIEELGTGS